MTRRQTLTRRARFGSPGTAAIFGLAALAALSGCTRTSPMHTGSISTAPTTAPQAIAAMNAAELGNVARTYGASYQADPQNKATGLAYASSLQMTGRNDQSLAVMQQMAIAHPEDRDVLAAYGKALAAAGDLPRALETVRRAQTPDYPDWRLLSTEGAILDQLGQPGPARALFQRALEIQPNEPSVLSNLGMSHLLANDLPSAERYLKSAVGQFGADSRVRQNLALVVGLQGRFDEAERIAAGELSAEEASANVAFLRTLLSQRNTWSELESENRA
ncbi:tetratricopeptide repeat protein [Aureimonas mangrovi]|uniref:tetratricopeptide repeat protein n=1 Tax=Aureimonas mangrovi TaxID=2758041 RepID=UPI00163DCFC9|nr:tetratricopeptide repeat protein [Aureimonas mangrovi]